MSQAFRWESLLTVGFRLSRSLWLSQRPFTNSPSFMMEFWLSRSLSQELSFSRWNLGYHEAFLMIVFTWWNLGYHRAFSRIFLSHGGVSAITEPFHEFFFHTVEYRLSRSLFTNFSFTRWNIGYHGAFSRIFFHTVEFTKCTIWGKTLFIYITRSTYIGSASLKILPLDLEPPLQGKEYDPPYSNVIVKKRKCFFLRNHL
jgi:hypothetical protein